MASSALTGAEIWLIASIRLHNWIIWSASQAPVSRHIRIADAHVIVDFINSSSQSGVQEIEEYLYNKYPGIGFPDAWVAQRQGALDLLERYRQLGRFWYEIYYATHPTNPRLAVHRGGLPAGSPASTEEALEAIRQAQLRDEARAAAESEPALPIDEFSRDESSTGPTRTPTPNPNPILIPNPNPSPRPSVPLEAPQAEAIRMPTTFPSEIKAKNIIVKFKGDPQQLASLDMSIYDLCDASNYPAYYGGTVIGSVSTEYVYCQSTTIGSADNYTFGRRFCSRVACEFEGNAQLWWEDYIQSGGARPNCWKLSELNGVPGSKPDRITEVSLYELLSTEFSAENDQQAADVELKRYRWNPLAKDAEPFATFKSHTKSLAKRAGYATWSFQAREIRNCVEPESLRSMVLLHNKEAEFLNAMQVLVNTALADYIAKELPGSRAYIRASNCVGGIVGG